MALTKITNSAIADDIGLGGNPTTSTQTAGDSTTRIATTAFVSTAVANLVNSAPDTLNTLAELATSIGNSTTLSSTLTSSIATKLPLAGGTLTGGLTGTTGTFSGALSSGAITSSGDVSAIETGHAKVVSNSVGDYFPSLEIKRTSGSSKTDKHWMFQIGSTGHLHVKDITNNTNALVLRENGDVYIGADSSALNPIINVDVSASSATFAGNITIPTGNKIAFDTDGLTYISEDIDERLRFWVANTEFMRMTNTTTDELRLLPYGGNLFAGGSLDVTGNIAVSGTVDGVDIAARDAILTSTTTTAGAALPKAGGTMTGSLAITTASTADTVTLTRGTTGQNNMLKFKTGSSDKWIVGQRNDSTDHFRFYSYGTSSDVVSILTDGKVGIGNTNPQGRLHLNDSGTTIPTSGYGTGLMVSRTDGLMGTMFGFLNSPQSGYLQVANFTNTDTLPFLINPRGGNVGIGVSDPDSKLEIKGSGGALGLTFKTTDASSNETFWINDGGRVGVRYGPLLVGIPSGTTPATSAVFQVEEAGLLTVLSTGKVGIGTTNPESLLTIQNDDAGIRLRSNTTTAKGLTLRYNHAGNFGQLLVDHQGNNQLAMKYYALSHSFGRSDSDVNVIMDDSGRLLVGSTTTDASTSERFLVKSTGGEHSRFVNSSDTYTTVYIKNTSTTANTNQPFLTFQDTGGNRGNFGLRYSTAQLVIQGHGGVGIAGGSGFNQDPDLFVNTSGNVGIGTTTPGNKFTLYDDGGYWATIQRGNSTPGSNAPWLGLFNNINISNATYGWGIYDSNVDGSFQIWNKNNSTTGYNTFTIKRGGNVGIGEPSPAEKLDVAGRIKSDDGLLSNHWQLYNTGTSGFLIGTNIAANGYGHIHGQIKLQQFNFNTQQIIDFSATVSSIAQTVHTKAATADIAVTIKMFVYTGVWYFWIPSPSTYSDISAYIHLGNGYQGSSRSSNAITALSSASVPSSGVTNSVDIVAQKRILANTSGNVGIGTDAPGSKLEVYNNTVVGNTQLHIHNDKTGDAGVLRIEGARTSSNDAAQILLANGGSIGSAIKMYTSGQEGDLRFYTSPANSGNTLHERIRITTSGSFKHLSGAGTLEFAPLGGSSNLIEGGGSIKIKAAGGSVDLLNGTLESLNTTAQGITVNGPNSADLIINAPTDNASLSIKAGTSDSGAEEAVVTFYQNTSPKWQMGNITTNEFRLYNYATSSAAILVDTSGKVGIGTDTPSAALEVARGSAGYAGIFGAPQGSGKVILFKDNHASPNKYNWLVGTQYNINNAFEITPSTVVGGYTFNNPGLSIGETGVVTVKQLHTTATAPMSFLSNSNTGTYNRTVLYSNQNNTGSNFNNGMHIEMGRISDSSSAEVRAFVIGARGGQSSFKVTERAAGVTQADGDYLVKMHETGADGYVDLFTGQATPVIRTRIASNGTSYFTPTGTTASNQAAVSVGESIGAKAGILNIRSTSSVAGGIRHRMSGGTQYLNIASTHTGSGSLPYWHIKTNAYYNQNVMFVARVHGYAYGNSGHIIDMQRSGYAYSGSSTALVGSQFVNNGSGTVDTLVAYYTSAGQLCFRAYAGASSYYTGMAFDIKMQSPTGYNFDFVVEAHNMNTTSGNYYT